MSNDRIKFRLLSIFQPLAMSSDVDVMSLDPITTTAFPQSHDEVVPSVTWWWAAHIAISVVAVIANFVFLLTVIYNRYVYKNYSDLLVQARNLLCYSGKDLA